MHQEPFQALDADLARENTDFEKLYITEEICDYWRQTSRWTSNIAVAGFVFFGLVMVFICYIISVQTTVSALFLLLLLGFAMILFSLSRRLYQYSVLIRKAADASEWEAMEKAFANLRTAYIIYGLFTMIGVLLLGVIVVSYFLLMRSNEIDY